jgi:putative peptidoglycan binding protein/caspase domain-containing protein
MSARFAGALFGALFGSLLLPALAAAATPAHIALIIGNATYATLPPLPACLQSSHAVAAAAHGAGFDVVEREDASSGAMDGAIDEFVTKLANAPDATTLIYVCSYGTAYNNRAFFLPVSANITRPADVLTQGVLAKSVLNALVRGKAGTTMVVIDALLAPTAGAPTAIGLNPEVQNLPDRTALIVASQIGQAQAPTVLAASLASQLKNPALQTAPLLATLQQDLAMRALTVDALHVPDASGYLTGTPPSNAPPAPNSLAAVAPPPLTPLAITVPADEQMSDGDRRLVQQILGKLGYYDGQVDGVFGPDTRAAIRRYQHELGVSMTGRLTAEQATKLVSNSR